MPISDTYPQKMLASDPKKNDAAQSAAEGVDVDWADRIEQARAGREMGRKLREGRSPVADSAGYR